MFEAKPGRRLRKLWGVVPERLRGVQRREIHSRTRTETNREGPQRESIPLKNPLFLKASEMRSKAAEKLCAQMAYKWF